MECFSVLSPMRTWVCRELVWRSYLIQRPCLLVAIRKVEFVDRWGFAAAAFDPDDKMLGGYGVLSGRACADAEPPYPPRRGLGSDKFIAGG